MRRNHAGATVRLKHIKIIRKPSGATFCYLALPGRKLVRLPDLPMDSPEFLAAYAEARRMAAPQEPKASPGSIKETVALYMRSAAYLDLGTLTRATRNGHLSKIVDRWGNAKTSDLRAEHIKADLSTLSPNPARHRLKTWRGLCKWAEDAGRMSANHALTIPPPAIPKTDGHTPWIATDIAAFRAHWPLTEPQRLAMELIYWTAARASDAVRLGPGMIDGDGWLTFKQQKTGGEVSIPFSRALPDFAAGMQADLDLLKQAISHAPRHMTWLVTAYGASRSVKAFSQWFSAAARDAGIFDKTAHGLRKARAISVAEAGGSTHQIAAWTGHETLSEVQRYSKGAARRRILSGTEREQKLETAHDSFQIITSSD
jgi:integrase